MTAYNREKYIAEAIESVLASSYTNYELIIVDDGSVDDTVQIALAYEQNDSRIKVYINEKNLGDYHNRNRAASYAIGKYIKYVDSDDIIYPHGLEVMVRCMEQFPKAAVGIMSLVNQDDKPYPFELAPKDSYRYHFFTKGLFDIGPTAMIFNREAFLLVGGFSGKRFIGDLEINLMLGSMFTVVKMPGSLVFWRIHDGQEFVIGNNSKGYVEGLLPLYEKAFEREACPLTIEEKNIVIKYNRKLFARHLFKMAVVERKPKQAYQLYKKLNLSIPDVWGGIFSLKAVVNR